VSGVIDKTVSEPFNALERASSMSKSTKNPKYFIQEADGSCRRMTSEEICKTWDEASQLGTALHAAIEMFFNESVSGDGLGKSDSGGPDTTQTASSYLERACKVFDLHFDGQTNVPEFAMFLRYWRKLAKAGWEPFRTELLCFDADLGVGGSVDFLCRNMHTGEIMLLDWKRCSVSGSGFNEAFRGRRLLPPVAHVEDTKLNHWRLQATMYVYMLKNHGIDVGVMAMVAFAAGDGMTEALEFVHHFSEDAATLMRHRAHCVQLALYSKDPAAEFGLCGDDPLLLPMEERAKIQAQPEWIKRQRFVNLCRRFGICGVLCSGFASAAVDGKEE
jgi:hypothetical protein